jgi:hypothetical protein
MTLPAVSWTIDGLSTPLLGWTATTTAFGGFGQMRGSILEADARRIPSSVTQGSVVTGYTSGGFVVYQGRLSAPPAIRGGLASFAAQGESVRAVKRANRLTYQKRGEDSWTDKTSAPHLYVSHPDQIHMTINPGGILFNFAPGETITPGENAGVAFWAPGPQGVAGLWRCQFSFLSSFIDPDWKLECYNMVGPSGAGSLIGTVNISALTSAVDFSAGIGLDQMILLLKYGGTSTKVLGGDYVLIRDLRVNSIAAGDSYLGSEVVTDVGRRLGFDVMGVVGSGLNILPLDWTSGSWAELLSYIATLEDRYWRVVEDSKLEYDAWGTKEWTVYQADGALVDLTPLELYNQVTVKYVDVGGAPREVTVTASPDPLAASGQVNVWTESLSDVQPDPDLPTAVANNLLPRVSTLRETGRIDVVKAYDSTGREAVREIRAGDTVRVADRDMNTASLHRIFEVEQDAEGVSLGIEGGVSIASMLARAGLVSARAPSTAELPELPPFVPETVTVEAGPAPEPSGIPSEEQQHRERFLTWPQGFPKR